MMRWLTVGLLATGVWLSSTAATVAQTLRALTTDNYPPFEFRIEETSERPGVYGFDIELAQTIAQRLGLQVTFQVGTFEQLLPQLIAGQGDLAIAAITPTPERSQQVDFSESYFEAQDSLVTLSNRPIPADNNLAGLTLGYIQGTVQAQRFIELQSRYPTLKGEKYLNVTEVFKALEAGKINTALVESVVAKIFAEDNSKLKVQPLSGTDVVRYAIAFPKGSAYRQAFNQELQRLRESGELDLMLRRWFAPQQ